jgi:FAD binding domain
MDWRDNGGRRNEQKTFLAGSGRSASVSANNLFVSARPYAGRRGSPSHSRLRPGDSAWPSAASWDRLSRDVGGRLVKVQSPLAACLEAPSSPSCAHLFKELKNPYFLGDEVGLTQSLGWVDAWTSQPSPYAMVAQTADDVVAAVNFARQNKGGGHSYQGTSNAPDSLLIWTRRMNAVTLHDAFIGAGCAGQHGPEKAVTVEAGAIWGRFMTRSRRRGAATFRVADA